VWAELRALTCLHAAGSHPESSSSPEAPGVWMQEGAAKTAKELTKIRASVTGLQVNHYRFGISHKWACDKCKCSSPKVVELRLSRTQTHLHTCSTHSALDGARVCVGAALGQACRM